MSLRTLHIGCLWPSEKSGGADRVLADLGKYLQTHGVDFEAVVAGPPGAVSPSGLPVATFGGDTDAGTRARWIGARRAVCERVDAGRIDLLVSHFALYASAALDRMRQVPHVVHFQGPWAAESRQEGAGHLSGFAKWCIERLVYASADCVIVLSEAFGELIQRDYGVAPERVRVIAGAADLQRFALDETRSEARTVLGWPQDRRMLVAVRRLVQRTGVDQLIEAMPAIAARVPDVLLQIAGTGPLLSELRQRVIGLELERHVRFLGYVPDEQLPLVYKAADLNVVPSRSLEGFGLTVVEALAVGTPSMVSPIGGLPEIISPLCPALVLRSHAAADIADGLTAALSGAFPLPGEDECRAFAHQRFSAEMMASRVADVYKEVWTRHRRAADVH